MPTPTKTQRSRKAQLLAASTAGLAALVCWVAVPAFAQPPQTTTTTAIAAPPQTPTNTATAHAAAARAAAQHTATDPAAAAKATAERAATLQAAALKAAAVNAAAVKAAALKAAALKAATAKAATTQAATAKAAADRTTAAVEAAATRTASQHPTPTPVVVAAHTTPPANTCAAALSYLTTHSAPGFNYQCPGYALGHQAMTCINIAGICPGTKLIVISTPCPASWMNEASNSWVLSGLAQRPIDPYGSC